MNRITAAALAACIGMGFALQAHAAPRIDVVTASDEADDEGSSVFAADAARIFVHGDLTDVETGSKVRSEWIAVKVKGVQPDYKIDTREVNILPSMYKVSFSLNKPSAGWPVGTYRVDFFVDDKLTAKASYKVE